MVETPTIVLKAIPEAIKEARDWVGMVLGAWGLESYTARIVVSEMATNAIMHGSEPGDLVVVRAYKRNGRPLVEAWDRSDDPPLIRVPGDLSESGRGLLLMEQLVVRWGTRALDGGGKVVWAELEAEPSS